MLLSDRLCLEGIDKTFPVHGSSVRALERVSLSIPAGRLTSILGASGSGKTTLLRVIAGFERPDRGEVSLDGRVLAGPGVHLRPEHRGVGIVPQDGALFPHLDVAGNVAFGLGRTMAERLAPTRRRATAARVEELLSLVGLEGFDRRRVDQLSGGQQQRVALARALAPNPGVILLDEPFSAIDAALRAQLGTEVRHLLGTLGITTVLVTHDQEEALSLADKVAVMRSGRVVQCGSPREVYENPVDGDIARFVGDAVVLDGTVVSCHDRDTQVDCGLGRLIAARGAPADTPSSWLAGHPCHVIIRPENFRMGASGIRAVVIASEYYGHDAVTTVRLGASGEGMTIRVRTFEARRLPEPGASVGIDVADPVLVVPSPA